jgi:putative transposase
LYDGKNEIHQKLKIIKEASEQGVKQTLEKYSVFPASYYAWKRKWKQWAKRVFSLTPDQLKRIRELERK